MARGPEAATSFCGFGPLYVRWTLGRLLQDRERYPGAPLLEVASVHDRDAVGLRYGACIGCGGGGRYEESHVRPVLDPGGAQELLHFAAPDRTVRGEALALHDDTAAVRRQCGDVHSTVAGAAVHHDVGAAVAAKQDGDVMLELPPAHGVDRRHDAGVR